MFSNLIWWENAVHFTSRKAFQTDASNYRKHQQTNVKKLCLYMICQCRKMCFHLFIFIFLLRELNPHQRWLINLKLRWKFVFIYVFLTECEIIVNRLHMDFMVWPWREFWIQWKWILSWLWWSVGCREINKK